MVTLYDNGSLEYNYGIYYSEMTEAERFGKNLKRIRSAIGISQGEISRRLVVSKGFISNAENGKTNPTLATVAKLAKALGVTPDELLR